MRSHGRLTGDGFPLLDGPRRAGDGYYESMVADPEGNRIIISEMTHRRGPRAGYAARP
jgi:hypothetical protein